MSKTRVQDGGHREGNAPSTSSTNVHLSKLGRHLELGKRVSAEGAPALGAGGRGQGAGGRGQVGGAGGG